MENGQIETEQKLSKYNAAVAQLYRVDKLWQLCHFYRGRGNPLKWNEKLDCIWTELASDADDEETKKFNKFTKDMIQNRKSKGILNQILINKEIWLRKLQNKQGKGSAYSDASEDDFE